MTENSCFDFYFHSTSIVYKVIGTIIFLWRDFTRKKNTKKAHKQIYTYKTLKKKFAIYIYALYAF